MSFCTQIKDELAGLPPRATCCRKSLLYGLLYGASLPVTKGEGLTIRIPVPSGASVDYSAYISGLLKSQYGLEVIPMQETRGAHRYLNLRFDQKQVIKTLSRLSVATQADPAVLHDAINFRCEDCASHFLRGVFLATGTVNDPAKSYHLEIRTPSDGRADLLCALLLEIGSMPGSTRRKGDVAFIWKSSSAVIDLLTFMGTTSGIFDIFNTQIERDIRNNENRATNCAVKNIVRATSAAGKQISAIQSLMANDDVWETLPQDLKDTAQLRLLHPEATLKELAELHSPAITKSGLNHRLQRLISAWEAICDP